MRARASGSAVRIRATSSATLPLPTITTRSWLEIDWQIGEVGVAVDPGDRLGGGAGAGQTHAVDVESAVVGRTDRVQHRVVVLEQFGVRKVLAHIDIEVEREPAAAADPVEQPGDPLGALVVGSHAGAHQTVWGGQLLEDVDPHAALGEQFVGGVHRGRSGADDRPPSAGWPRAAPSARAAPAPAWTSAAASPRRAGPGRRPALIATNGSCSAVEPAVRDDGADRAGADARAAVHAGHRVDVEHLGGGEARFVRRRMDAVHRAGVDTGPVAATRLGDHVGHVVATRQRTTCRRCGSLRYRLGGPSILQIRHISFAGRVHQPGVVSRASGRRRTCRAASAGTPGRGRTVPCGPSAGCRTRGRSCAAER